MTEEVRSIIVEASDRAGRMARALENIIDMAEGNPLKKEDKENLVDGGRLAVDILRVIDRELTDLSNRMEAHEWELRKKGERNE